ncbi:porin [Pseudomonadota bacterium]|nr:porin [Pseudomonadota bacterium]
MYKYQFKFLLFFTSLAGITNIFAANIYSSEDSSIDVYGSLRLQGEYVSADEVRAGEDDSYSGLRDAYSRFGIKASTSISNDITLAAKLEVPFNLAKLRVQDPTFFDGFYKDSSSNAPRIYQVTASSKTYGSINFGKQWLAYYNNITYPVDYFSSFYSGYATYSTFRREALTYTSPTFSGFSGVISGVDLTDANGTNYLDTMQYAASYAKGPITFAVAYQDTHDDRANLIGVSASYTTGPWRFASKVEQLQSNSSVVENKDPTLFNVYGSYTVNKWTIKAMYANGDGKEGKNGEGDAFFIGDSYQLGVDYQYDDKIKFFAEYFYEQNSYAIYTPNSKSFEPLANYQTEANGNAFSLGARFDF